MRQASGGVEEREDGTGDRMEGVGVGQGQVDSNAWAGRPTLDWDMAFYTCLCTCRRRHGSLVNDSCVSVWCGVVVVWPFVCRVCVVKCLCMHCLPVVGRADPGLLLPACSNPSLPCLPCLITLYTSLLLFSPSSFSFFSPPTVTVCLTACTLPPPCW